MALNNVISLRYGDVISPLLRSTPGLVEGEFFDHAPICSAWGSIWMRDLVMPDFRIISFTSDLHVNLHLRHEREKETTTVDTCVMLNGAIDSTFSGIKGKISLKKDGHNFIYKPETADDHYIGVQKQLQLFHIAINLDYYISLLCEKESWSASLKERIQNKEALSGSTEQLLLLPAMRRIVLDVLHCPLKGNLRAILMEAKMLEFVALQLDQYRNGDAYTTRGVYSKDKIAFYDLKEFLDRTFAENHSLKNLSRNFGLNEFKLKKGFREIFGTTVFDYLHELRMNHARQLLLDTGLFVNEVSAQVGYKNPNHFSTAFKKKFGLSPASVKN